MPPERPAPADASHSDQPVTTLADLENTIMSARALPSGDVVQAVEDFIADVQFRLHNLMRAKGVDHAELAARTSVTEAEIDVLFGDRPNLTLERLAVIFHALGERPVITSPGLDAVFADEPADGATRASARGNVDDNGEAGPSQACEMRDRGDTARARPRTYRSEFPDFILDVEIPEGFEDSSWKNDTCPCFINTAMRMRLFVDYADPAQREMPDLKRFLITDVEADGSPVENSKTLIETDDWNEVVAFVAARRCGAPGAR